MSSEHTFRTGTHGRTATRNTEFGGTELGGTTTRFLASRRGYRLRRRWRRARRAVLRRGTALRAWLGETITAPGWFVLAAGVAGAIAGPTWGWVEGWYLLAVSVVLVMAAGPFLLGVRAYRMEVSVDRERVFAGGEFRVELEAENLSGRPALPAIAELTVGDAMVEIALPLLGAHATHTLRLPLTAPNRGVIRLGPVTLTRRDPLSLFRREMTWRRRTKLWVHPRIVPLPQHSAGMVRDLEGQTSRQLTDSDLAFHAVRDYARGDSYRHVHWRSTAKTGALMVRQYEETRLARVAVLFDALRAEYASDEEFELAVSVAASISVQAIRDGRERFIGSGWHAQTGDAAGGNLVELPARTTSMMLDSWAELSALEDGPTIEILAHQASRGHGQLSIVYLIAGSRTDTARLRRAAILFPPTVSIVVVRAEHLADPVRAAFGALTMLSVGALTDLPQLLFRGNDR